MYIDCVNLYVHTQVELEYKFLENNLIVYIDMNALLLSSRMAKKMW